MRRFKLYIIINTFVLFISTLGITYCIHIGFFFSSILCSLICIGVLINIFRLQNKQTKTFLKAIDHINYNDFTGSIFPHTTDKYEITLAEKLSTLVKNLKERTLSEESKLQYYESLMNKVDTAVVTTDNTGRIIWMNKAAQFLLGHETFKLPEYINEAIQNNSKVIQKKGKEKTMDLSLSSTQINIHGKEQYIITLNNIHSALERKEMEAWQKLIRVLTHEIMNSITPIISLSDTLNEMSQEFPLKENTQNSITQGLGIINRRCKGLMEFVDNYRKLTRISSPIKSPINITDFFDDVKGLTAKEFVHFYTEKKDMTLIADKVQMEQTLLNIIKNAIEACRNIKSPKVEVGAYYTDNGKIKLIVSDNGEGILPDVKERIFVPFFTTKSNGSGIGLSLCKQIITMHGGNIYVESEVGKGSKFIIIL